MADEKTIMDDIGINAGRIYRFLEDHQEGDSPVKATQAKDELNLSTSDVYLALGWLAREDQVEVLKKGNSVRININF
ncbi:MAG: winged helix-turn-helix domain-containing protein [bacterium]